MPTQPIAPVLKQNIDSLNCLIVIDVNICLILF